MPKVLGLTLYTVVGPRVSKRFDGKDFYGGWSFLERSIDLIEAQLTADIQLSIEIKIAHHKSFGNLDGLLVKEKSNRLKVSVVLIDLFEESANRATGSLQHGLLLNALIEQYPPRTSFYGVIDPDCYLLDLEGLVSILRKMEKEAIATMGVSYPNTFPPHYYWDFPVAYFQIFSKTLVDATELNFLPSADLHYLRGFKSLIENRGIIKDKTRVIALKIMDWLRFSRITFYRSLSITAYFILEKKYTAARDTGCMNRENFIKKRMLNLTIPVYFEQSNFKLPFFRRYEYIYSNPEVVEVFNPETHFLFHGIYENREIGNQRMFYKLLVHLIRRNGSIDKNIHPVSSVTCSSKTGTSSDNDLFRKISTGGFLYLYEGNPFCVHLSHTAKKNLGECFRYLDWLAHTARFEKVNLR